mmetsp:Transcript_755/g.954  ORF Transcript_755/g.954 Transcript_755/m.954 type:complete len:414 (+) Transcript_755:94-1335(+)
MLGSFKRFARRTFATFKKAPGRRAEKKSWKKSSWKGYFSRIYSPGLRRLLLGTSMVAPMYRDEDKKHRFQPDFRRFRSSSPNAKQTEGGVQGAHQTPRMSQMIMKFFGKRCVGLAQLGMFAAAHNIPEDDEAKERKPFQNLDDIFNMGDRKGKVERKRTAEGTPRKSPAADSRSAARAHPEQKTSTGATNQTPHPSKEDIMYFEKRVTSGGVLVLRSEDIVAGRWEALSSYLKYTPRVTILRLQGVEITTKELNIIGASLKEIRHITFCDNSIGLNQGAFEVLCATLLCCSLLESTSIVRNSLDDEHIPQIVELVSKHSSLKELSLCWNGIGDKGALHLAQALEDMSQAVTLSLRLLDLSYNRIGSLGREKLEAFRGKDWRNMYGDPLCIQWKPQAGGDCSTTTTAATIRTKS